MQALRGRTTVEFVRQMMDVGPALSYVAPPICGHALVAEFKRLPEMNTLNTLNGNYLWVKLSSSF
jgi:hypothetical protein